MDKFRFKFRLFLNCMANGFSDAREELRPGKVSDKAYSKLHHNIPGWSEKIDSLYLKGEIDVVKIGLRE